MRIRYAPRTIPLRFFHSVSLMYFSPHPMNPLVRMGGVALRAVPFMRLLTRR